MKLVNKGLGVILLPLIFQVLLSACLIVGIFQTQDEAESIGKTDAILQKSNLLWEQLAYAIGSMLESQRDEAAHPPVAEYNNFLPQLTEFINMTDARAEFLRANTRLDKSGHQIIVMLCAPFTPIADPHAVTLRNPDYYEPKLLNALEDFDDALIHIVSIEVHANEAAELKKDDRHVWLHTAIGIGIVGAILTALFALFCIYDTKRLLKVIEANADRFSKRIPFVSTLQGKDDLARIDQVFAVMDNSLRQAQQREKDLMVHAANLICSLSKDGVFERINPSGLNMLGYQRRQLLNMSLLDIVAGEDIARADDALHQASQSEGSHTFDLKIQTEKGNSIETSWSTFWSESDQNLFCVVNDITEQKNIEQLKQDFIAMISHDLRSPLTAVSNSVSMVLSGVGGAIPEKAAHTLTVVERSINRLVKLVNDLLDFEKLHSGNMRMNLTKTNVQSLIEASVQEVQALAEQSNIRLAISAAPSIMLDADGERLTQVIINLLSNAIRYCKKDGTVTVAAIESAAGVEISVNDEGSGIPPESLQRIFAPFEKASTSIETKEGGTGLGLAICKLVVDAHNGTISAENRMTGGASFKFTIPNT